MFIYRSLAFEENWFPLSVCITISWQWVPSSAVYWPGSSSRPEITIYYNKGQYYILYHNYWHCISIDLRCQKAIYMCICYLCVHVICVCITISLCMCTCSEGKRLSSRAGKLKCILAYFQKAAENRADLAGMITVRRQVCVCMGLRSTNLITHWLESVHTHSITDTYVLWAQCI